MNKRSIEILNAIIENEPLRDEYDCKLIIIGKTKFDSRINVPSGAFLSFDNLRAGDFFEIYRYKKSLEEKEVKK